MMLILSGDDISRLSAACQQEIFALIGLRRDQNAFSDESEGGFDGLDAWEGLSYEAEETRYDVKRVIDITPDQAKALLANISEKSRQTLQRFVEGIPTALDELIGDDKPYENLTDLKRSFVGAVTRRLRTVTQDRQATLFLKSTLVDGTGEERSAVYVRPATAEALRIAFDFPESPSIQE